MLKSPRAARKPTPKTTQETTPKTTARKSPPPPKPSALPKQFEFHSVTPEELSADGTVLLLLTIPGRPATKKTHQRVVKRGRFTKILPSIQYEEYEAHCQSYCEAAWRSEGRPALDFGVRVVLRVFLNTWQVGDHCGYMQSVGDIIEKWGIIADDSWIHWADVGGEHWFGGVDKESPRVEVTVIRYRHPKEAYRLEQEEAERGLVERRKAREEKATLRDREAASKAARTTLSAPQVALRSHAAADIMALLEPITETGRASAAVVMTDEL